jgi:hypothetical protein
MPDDVSADFTGRLVVRLASPVVSRLAARAHNPAFTDFTSLSDLAEEFAPGLRAVLRSYPPDLPTYPVVRGTRPIEILTREAEAEHAGFPTMNSLIGYFVIDPREKLTPARAAQLLDDLNSLETTPAEVDYVYLEPNVKAPTASWVVTPDPLVSEQGYLDPSPKGIGVNTAAVWGAFNGAGIGFVDMESGWNLNHVELPPALLKPQPILNLDDRLEHEHGTGVLGIVLSQANGSGITGIAPAAKFLGVASWLASLHPFTPEIAKTISDLYPIMSAGHVLLIEVETASGYPVEVDEAVLIAIQTLAGKGVVVVEAAGNGTATAGRDLDKPLPAQGTPPKKPAYSLKRGASSFADSYAIMVSACRSQVTSQGGHRRIARAGFGSRIDCYA